LALGGAVVASAASADPAWSPWVEFGGYYGSDSASRGELALWVPLAQGGGRVFFLDARGKLFEDQFLEGNVALGGRVMLDGGWNLGLWGGYDARQTGSGNVFHQASAGVEALGETFDVRANAYVPLSGAAASDNAEVFFSGNDIFMSGALEVPLYGVDAEIGAKLPLAGDGAVLAV
jgi:hypothetical protein